MAIITVTTGSDVVSGIDGKTSLREAVAQAHDGDIITFSHASIVNLSSQLTITEDVTIDGLTGGLGEFNSVDVNGGGIVIAPGAAVTLSHLMISGGGIGTSGTDGAEGEDGTPATDGTPGPSGSGGNGGDATNGGSGGDAATSVVGQSALAGIENDGTLTLDHVELNAVSATGGDTGKQIVQGRIERLG